MSDILLEKSVGNYVIKEKIGSGAMGSVYMAVHSLMGKKIAVKVLASHLSESKVVRDRFLMEAKAISVLDHPNIIEMFDFGVFEDGRMYYLMELLTGSPLNEILSKSVLTLDFITRITEQICDALDYVHQQGIIHRDLKPGNIFIARKGNSETIKILDFGVAKLFDYLKEDSSHKTSDGTILGTPAYMSPEQAMGKNNEISQLTDIYAIGVLLYKMFTGQVPVPGGNIGEVVSNHILSTPILPHFHNPSITPEISAVIMRSIAKVPADRFQTALELSSALRQACFTAPVDFTVNFTTVSQDKNSRSFSGQNSSPGFSVPQDYNKPSFLNSLSDQPPPPPDFDPDENWVNPAFSTESKTDPPDISQAYLSDLSLNKSVESPSSISQHYSAPGTAIPSGQETPQKNKKTGLLVSGIVVTSAFLAFGAWFLFFPKNVAVEVDDYTLYHPVEVKLSVARKIVPMVEKSIPTEVDYLIKSKPDHSNIKIKINDQTISGKTPYTLKTKSGTRFTAVISMPGYEDSVKFITVKEAGEMLIELNKLKEENPQPRVVTPGMVTNPKPIMRKKPNEMSIGDDLL